MCTDRCVGFVSPFNHFCARFLETWTFVLNIWGRDWYFTCAFTITWIPVHRHGVHVGQWCVEVVPQSNDKNSAWHAISWGLVHKRRRDHVPIGCISECGIVPFATESGWWIQCTTMMVDLGQAVIWRKSGWDNEIGQNWSTGQPLGWWCAQIVLN